MRILGIESSCDETAAAVVAQMNGSLCVLSNIVHSQVAAHAPFGGVVPEVASREHIGRIVEVVEGAVAGAGGLEHINGVAVTRGPGLVGSLLVGLQFAKGFALGRRLPFVGVNHLEGHLATARLAREPPPYPHVALVVSGGHSHLYDVEAFGCYRLLGGTRDDAAGEAFDKIAKLLGLGYPGGVAIEREAHGGDARAFNLPRGIPNKKVLDFSFSGLKTAAAETLRRRGALSTRERRDFCASVQEAIGDVLSKKAVAAAQGCGRGGVVVAGGVGANSRLRELLRARTERAGLWSFVPDKALCTDNGAMIAAAGLLRLQKGEITPWEMPPLSRWPLEPPPSPELRAGSATEIGMSSI